MWPTPSPRTRRNIGRLVPFGVIFVLLAQVFLISDYAAAGGSFSDVPDSAIALTPSIYIYATIAVALVGMLVGAVELFFLNKLFAARSLRTKLVGKTAFYAGLLSLIMLVTFPVAASMELGTSLFDPEVWHRFRLFAISETSVATGVQLTTQVVAAIFYSEMSEHMGYHVLRNFLSGRYHTPREEERIFLFSDMKSSTQIAERLGHERYFELLKAYYDALAAAIVDHGGEVYQYVGDEIVVSWPEAKGVHDASCLSCVLRMKEDLRTQAGAFEHRFGVAPDFKAGLQIGPVTTGEIGALKKEIVFTGDVLNQTSRIHGLCAGLGSDILVGGELVTRLAGAGGVRLTPLGTHVLRGREQPVELFGVGDASETTGPEKSGARRIDDAPSRPTDD